MIRYLDLVCEFWGVVFVVLGECLGSVAVRLCKLTRKMSDSSSRGEDYEWRFELQLCYVAVGYSLKCPYLRELWRSSHNFGVARVRL